MADTQELREELVLRKDECFDLKKGHNKAAEVFEHRYNRVTVAALVFSALTGATAVWSAIEAMIDAPPFLVLWATALTGVITTVLAGLQQIPWAGAEYAKTHQKAATEFGAIARDAERVLTESEDRFAEALPRVDERMNQLHSSAPFLQEKFRLTSPLERLSDLGLVDAFEARDSGEAAALLGDLFKSKPKKVQILETWTGYGSQLSTWITQAVKDGADVEILLLDPTSKHVEHRAEALSATGVNAKRIENAIRSDLDILKRVRDECHQNRYKGKLTIRIYNVTPVVNMYRFDKIRIVGMYLWGEDSITGPQFKVKGTKGLRRTPFADDFDAHFKKIWDYSGKTAENFQ